MKPLRHITSNEVYQPSVNETRLYVAEAVPIGDGAKIFRGHYALPGGMVHSVHDADGSCLYFNNADEAELQAFRALRQIMNGKIPKTYGEVVKRGGPVAQGHGKSARYKKTTADYFSFLVNRLNRDLEYLAWLIGTSHDRFRKWMRGEEPIDHKSYLLMEIFNDDDIGARALQIANDKTELMAEDRVPRKLREQGQSNA